MLVLTRRKDEEVVIQVPGRPTPIVVEIADIRGDKVRVGIHAEPDIKIDRREVYEANQAATRATFEGAANP